MGLLPTDKIVMILEKNETLEKVIRDFKDYIFQSCNIIEIFFVDKVLNPMFNKDLIENVPVVGTMFLANGITKEDLELIKNATDKIGKGMINIHYDYETE